VSSCTCDKWMGQGHSPGCFERLTFRIATLESELAEAKARVSQLEEESRSGAWTQLKYMVGGEELICQLSDDLTQAKARAEKAEAQLEMIRVVVLGSAPGARPFDAAVTNLGLLSPSGETKGAG
jgi:hypothetical protein